MSEKHTPGPWEVLAEERERPYLRVRGTRLGGRFKVANVLTPTYENVHPREAEETRANARLIAAAPMLLEALIEMEREKSDYMTRNKLGNPAEEHTNKMARAAIAAATGENRHE